MKTKIAILICFFLFPFVSKSQQVPQFSQYLFNPIYINPAYTGYKGDTFIQSYIRKQWIGLEGGPTNFGIAADGFLSDKNIGIGFHAGAETIGFQSTSTYQGKFAYHLQLSRVSYLSMGMSAGFWNQKIDSEMIDPIQGNDPLLASNFDSVFYPELSFGLFYYHPNYFFSAALSNVFSDLSNNSSSDFYQDPKKSLNISAGFVLEFYGDRTLEGSLLLMSDNKAPARIDLNLNFFLNRVIGFGLGSRNYSNFLSDFDQASSFSSMQIIFLTEINISEKFRMGYSFDYDFKNPFNSHELSVGYTIKNKSLKILSPRYF